jgi:hypothetical protein
VNGVSEVNVNDYTSYYPKSVVKANIATDTLERRFPFTAAFNHAIDMEALSFGPDGGTSYLYIGDEHNYIYQMQVWDGALSRQWDLRTINIAAPTQDQGIESMTYAADTGHFYVGIQESRIIYKLSLSMTSSTVTLVSQFTAANAPSGLFYYAPQQALYVMMGVSTNGDQYLYKYSTVGTLECAVIRFTFHIPHMCVLARGCFCMRSYMMPLTFSFVLLLP